MNTAIPTDPPLGLLISMAIRYDHGLGIPDYYNQLIFADSGATHAQRFKSAISMMRQLYEEVAGNGFYSPDKETYYCSEYKQYLE